MIKADEARQLSEQYSSERMLYFMETANEQIRRAALNGKRSVCLYGKSWPDIEEESELWQKLREEMEKLGYKVHLTDNDCMEAVVCETNISW